MAKTPQLHPKHSIPVSYPNSPLSPYSGALVLQFAAGPFYIFVALSLIILYQLESLYLDNFNLIYIQNKNRGFDKFLIATPLKTQHFPFYKHSLKPIQTNTNQQYTSKLNPKQPLIQLQPIQTPFHKVRVFPQIQTQEKEVTV